MTIKIWDLVNFYMLISLPAHDEPVRHVGILSDTGNLVSCSSDGTLVIWDYIRKKKLRTFTKKCPLLCFDYFPSQKTLFVGTESENIVAFLVGEKPERSENPNDSFFDEEFKEGDVSY
eukprot:TRINITY_DN6144_c0_g1_i1.p1 TRINITY_DN6144_c0_g1~~TRINITY_DN6144_c0_g1_i1.p1  ORF type:complete len:118 (-),score=17.33 TRINITY_DN6144_c0_g1_i1:3-356(-)